MKAIMISIKPKYVADILNGKKTIEIRKSIPKCDLPIDVYIYCTKDTKDLLVRYIDYDHSTMSYYGCWINRIVPNNEQNRNEESKYCHCLNGKVVAKFTLNKVEEIEYQGDFPYHYEELLKKSCLGMAEFRTYLFLDGRFGGYAWHIDNLVIFDKPKELSEFKYYKKFSEIDYMLPIPRKETCERLVALTRAPQSWCYIEI